MVRHFGMAFAPWDALGGGKFQSKKQLEERKKNGENLRSMMGSGEQDEQQIKVSEALTKVAEEHGLESPTTIALAYVMAKTPNVFPIVGGRKVEHLKENIKCLEIKLTDKQIEYLESIVPFELGFPQNFFGADPHVTGQAGGLLGTVAQIAWVRDSKAIGHE
jgi:aryl-alcohol dehydrogenase-like predicted oxidoreductase